ncbi:hypothetical protein Kpol_1067p8 [Vanderwaltozyma polyspora DSM 70294]|uniref:Phosphatase PP2A regulatory subunit A/Splicing factor 3B subunit 1-like HEAT repeat domain-containing protein n=1 Tax=Vanderwaltozyma polyspora (strain ATCC 22028 / DSM 70294 / BCRC 21397 / CBS 2163 / NBRC 10782 / NRRL Y-8283 / UCD 57-17) TaxID=436907 RepID=A7TNV3_VANPO|nr:uncharacterized protein Kpol_1067p8 [Vanderwaltozyma polyspora DSM 70294]EDO16036.1 hypothetical protein Kpol_1067p8 [Vanderwaltozyma polyspora DSM 70294]
MSHRLGGSYSVPNELRQELQQSAEVEGSDELATVEKSKSIYEKEDVYHRKRLDIVAGKINSEQGKIRKRDVDEEVVKPKKKSRWDVQTYEVPSLEASKELHENAEATSIPDVAIAQNLRYFKPSDRKYFPEVLELSNKKEMTVEELKEKSLIGLLLRIKNGNSASRKVSIRSLSDKAEEFGPKLIFDRVLPILLDKSLEDQERHLMIKVIDRVLFKLGHLVRPYVTNILQVTSPLLIDEDPITRATGRDIISNLSNAAGFATMITAIRPDVENDDEYIRNLASRSLAVVAKTVGIPLMIPFIKAVCHSKKSWKARHTASKIILQIANLAGIGILPHLDGLVNCISDGLNDEHIQIRTSTANALSSLAQNSYPYGIDSFSEVIEPLWKGIRSHRGRVLASFLKCMGSLIPLMNNDYAGYYTQEVMRVVQREFSSPDEDMKKTVLVVLQNCCKTEVLTPKYLRDTVAPEFFKHFWLRRTALDKQLNKAVTYTTVVLGEKIGCSFIIENLMGPLNDEAEPFRTMAVHAINRVVKQLGTDELNERQETKLIDGLLIAFQEQKNNDTVIYKGFGTVATSLNTRMKPYLSPIVSTILNQLKHKAQYVRENAADLCSILVPVIKNCSEDQMLNKLNVILYESLGEVYPDVLGSIIGAIHQIVLTMKLDLLQPPVNQILPTLTPILRNTHKKVQVNTINLVGLIARIGPEYVPAKEWMRICFELLELLKSTNKSIRKAANRTFGYIAKAIGPNDVLVALLNNLKVQERQLRVCTAVAIGIVADVCGAYTVLPAILNEYKTPETNVQNGILKALAFILEYIGETSSDYIYFIVPLLEDALTDRDLVHRQTAADAIKHLALYCSRTGKEDAFIHILNLLMPNIFETSPHVIVRIIDALEATSLAIGPGVFMNYVWAGLFHPARNVRKSFWKLYNKLYIQHGDALIPYYPNVASSELGIEELDIVL